MPPRSAASPTTHLSSSRATGMSAVCMPMAFARRAISSTPPPVAMWLPLRRSLRLRIAGGSAGCSSAWRAGQSFPLCTSASSQTAARIGPVTWFLI